jgi:protein-L-isoaspartate O-methyltransferase
MGLDEAIGIVQRLNASTEALAALAAELRLRTEGLEADPAVRSRLQDVTEQLSPGLLDALDVEEQRRALGMIRAFLGQAMELIDHPDRAPGWIHTDPAILQSIGRTSMMVAPLIREFVPAALLTAMNQPGAVFLDIGTGVGWLAVALCQTFPHATGVGLDIWPPALEMARQNIEAAGLQERIALREQDIVDLADEDAFDLVWLPGPFLPEATTRAALDRGLTALRPGGAMVFGLFAGPPDPLATTLTDLRVVRSGGRPWSLDEAADLLGAAGYGDVQAIERTWQAPLQMAVGRRPA